MAEKTLQELTNQIGAESQPVTALGAQQIGATPKQQDMAGTKAAKKKVLKEATLVAAERATATPVTPAVSASSEAKQKAEQLQQVGGTLSARIPAAIEKQLTTQVEKIATAQPQVNQTALGQAMGLSTSQIASQKSDPNSQYNKIANSLLAFANSTDVDARTVALGSLQSQGIDPATAANLIDTTAAAAGKQVQKQALTVSQLDLTGLAEGVNSVEDLAKTLNVPADTLKAMPVEELPKLIQDVQQQEVSRAQELRAQIAALPANSQQAQILVRELQTLEGTGEAAAERAVTQTIQELNVADQIDIGGQKYSAKDLLQDGQLSNLITNWLQAPTPEAREAIISSAEYPDLARWLGTNEKSLGALATSLQTGAGEFAQTQAAKQQLVQSAGVSDATLAAALPGVNLSAAMTPDQLKAAQDAFNASALGQLVSSGNTEAVAALDRLPADQKASVLGMSASDISAAYEAAQALKSDPDLAEISTLTNQVGDFLTDPRLLKQVQDTKVVLDKVRASNPTWLNEPFFRNLRPDQMADVLKAPQKFNDLQKYSDNANKIRPLLRGDKKDPKVLDSLLDTVMGMDVNTTDINNKYADAVKWAKMGDKNAAQVKSDMEKTFGLSVARPTVGPDTAEKLQKSLQKILNQTNPDAIIRGQSKMISGADFMANKKSLVEQAYSPASDSVFSRFSDYLQDGKFDVADMTKAVKTSDPKDIVELINTMPNKDAQLKKFEQVSTQVAKADMSALAATMLPEGFKDISDLVTNGATKLSKLPREQFNKAADVLKAAKQAVIDQAAGNPTKEAWAKEYAKKIDSILVQGEQPLLRAEVARSAGQAPVGTSVGYGSGIDINKAKIPVSF